MKFRYQYYLIFISLFTSLFIWSCSAKKEGKKLHLMKNLTAHYNIYFNANELLKTSEINIKKSLVDDFTQILDIFPKLTEETTSGETANLNEVVKKANSIALDKYESNWLDDSYLLLARAEYLKGDYYNAAEYYSYVSITFPKEKKNKLAAYLGQVKTDFALGNIAEADSILELAANLKYKFYKDDLEASMAQLALLRGNYKIAENHLQRAINFTHNNYKRIRWSYTLAQLQELILRPKEAYRNYQNIVASNASFEMSFNANLARIRINENASGKQFNRITTLKKLLKEDKNKEFKEQIYYQIGIAYSQLKQYDKAIEYYKISAHETPGTVKQKGLSFLKLAELNFDSLKNYTQAQLYYDSTLQYLPKNYPNYQTIANKANNLQYLADRLTIIEQQKKLLKFSNFTDQEMEAKVDELLKEKQQPLKKSDSAPSTPQIGNNSNISPTSQKEGSFYFYNSLAISQGFNEFKKKWGNRKLSDNWRSGTGNLVSDISKNSNLNSTNTGGVALNRDSIKAEFLKTLPFSPAAKQTANDEISKALYEIAIFYKDVLKDNAEASEAFSALLIEYPNHPNAASIYYQLYRLLENTEKSKADNFKAQLLQKFPESIFAKTISDPNFGKEEERLDEEIRNSYRMIYDLFQQKRYLQTIKQIAILQDSLGSFRKLEAQFAYLKALAVGHTERVAEFLTALNSIVKNYPDHAEVTPRVKQQIDYIAGHRGVFEQRPVALLDRDENEKIINGQEILNFRKAEKDSTISISEPKEEVKKEVLANVANKDSKVNETKEVPKEIVPDKPEKILFSTNTRQRHLIVIDITDPKVNVAQSFSRLSQYFYSKFDPSTVNLVIRVIGQSDKFIIVSGNFYSKPDVEKVAEELKASLPKIMEGQTKEYINFIISEANLSLLTDRAAIEQYIKSISEKK